MYLSSKIPIEGKIYYIVKGFRDKTGKSTSKNVRRLGTLEEIRKREGVADAWAWIKSQLELENARENEGKRKVSVIFSPDRIIEKDEQRLFNIGYLPLQKLYYELGIGLINDGISRRSGFRYDLDEIVRQIVLGRILWPSSKLQTWGKSSGMALCKPVSLHQYYRSLIGLDTQIIMLKKLKYVNAMTRKR